MTETKPKPSRLALAALANLLRSIARDGRVDDDELVALYQWRHEHRRALGHRRLREFRDWFDAAIADGEIDANERKELIAWTDRVGSYEDEASEKDYLAGRNAPDADPPAWKNRDANWRTLPATERQIALLNELKIWDHPKNRGHASDLISVGLAKRTAHKSSRYEENSDYENAGGREKAKNRQQPGGCMLMLLFLVVGAFVFYAVA